MRPVIIILLQILTFTSLAIHISPYYNTGFILPLFCVMISLFSDFDSDFDYVFGVKFLFYKRKKIHCDYKNVYTIFKNGYIYLYHDKIFILEKIAKIRYDSNIKNKILDEINMYFTPTPEEIINHRYKKEFIRWDGCLTKEDSRDKKLNQLI